jgi:hypothetical protein
MDDKKQALLKIFSAVLKERSKAEHEFREISPEILRHFSRKELIEIITSKIYNGTVPPEINLVEMENGELLSIIGDDMYIIAYVSEKWCEGVLSLPNRSELNEQIRNRSRSNASGTPDTKPPKKENAQQQST